MVDRNRTETVYTYNMYNSILERRAKNYTDPEMGLTESYQYTPEGLLQAAISATGMHYNYEYDAMGRIIRKSASGRTLISYAYDLNENLTHQKDVTGKETEYTYNALELLENVVDNGNKVAKYAYYPDGTIKSLASGSLYTEYAYDADRNLTDLKIHLGTEV